MQANPEAMQDLKLILEGRAPFYGKADATVYTSATSLSGAFERLRESLSSLLNSKESGLQAK